MPTFPEAVAAFYATQDRYAAFGACDTEPRTEFISLLEDMFEGREVKVPRTADGWQLYTGEGQKGVGLAAAALTRSMNHVIEAARADLPALAKFVREW